jgi:hypothetical protein
MHCLIDDEPVDRAWFNHHWVADINMNLCISFEIKEHVFSRPLLKVVDCFHEYISLLQLIPLTTE